MIWSRRTALAFVTTVLLVGACAPRYLLPGPDIARPVLEADTLTTRDGTRLALKSWASPDPRAVVVAVHGFNDYSNSFAQGAEEWAKNGVTTYAYDQRGFGATPTFGRWPGKKAFTSDLDDAVNAIAGAHPGLPLYVLGESMGGAVVLSWAAETGAPGVKGLVLVAPAVWGWSTMNPLYKTTLWLAARMTPSKTLTGARLERWPSDNIPMLRALSHDPKVIKATRVDTIYGLVGLMDEGYRAAHAEAGPPVLILYGKNDKIVPAKPVRETATALGARARFVLYPTGYHMLLRDLRAQIVWSDVLAFLADPAAPLPSGLQQAPGPDAKTTAATMP